MLPGPETICDDTYSAKSQSQCIVGIRVGLFANAAMVGNQQGMCPGYLHLLLPRSRNQHPLEPSLPTTIFEEYCFLRCSSRQVNPYMIPLYYVLPQPYVLPRRMRWLLFFPLHPLLCSTLPGSPSHYNEVHTGVFHMKPGMCSYLEWQPNVDPSTLHKFQACVQLLPDPDLDPDFIPDGSCFSLNRYQHLACILPPHPHLEHSQVVDYRNFSELEILDHDLLSRPWATLTNRQAANEYFK